MYELKHAQNVGPHKLKYDQVIDVLLTQQVTRKGPSEWALMCQPENKRTSFPQLKYLNSSMFKRLDSISPKMTELLMFSVLNKQQKIVIVKVPLLILDSVFLTEECIMFVLFSDRNLWPLKNHFSCIWFRVFFRRVAKQVLISKKRMGKLQGI